HAGWPGRPRAPDADFPHRRRRRPDLRARGRPLRRGEGGRNPGAALLARLRPTDPGVAPRRDGVLDLVDSVRRLCEDGRVRGRRDSVVLHIAQGDTAARVATVLALSPYLEPVISSVTSGGAAVKAGLMPSDRILKVNGDTVVSWQDFARVARRNPERPITVEV